LPKHFEENGVIII